MLPTRRRPIPAARPKVAIASRQPARSATVGSPIASAAWRTGLVSGRNSSATARTSAIDSRIVSSVAGMPGTRGASLRSPFPDSGHRLRHRSKARTAAQWVTTSAFNLEKAAGGTGFSSESRSTSASQPSAPGTDPDTNTSETFTDVDLETRRLRPAGTAAVGAPNWVGADWRRR
jgi:hypothetical protein